MTNKSKVVSLFIKNKWGDEIIKNFVDKTPQEIKNELWRKNEFFACEIIYKTQNCDENYINHLLDVIYDIEDSSWLWE